MIRNIAVTPRRQTARAIPLGKASVGAVIVSRRPVSRDEMKARMRPGVTAVDRMPRYGSPKQGIGRGDRGDLAQPVTTEANCPYR
jgi:hypothetical protein